MGGDRLVARNRQRGGTVDEVTIHIAWSDFNQGDQKIRKFSASNRDDDHI